MLDMSPNEMKEAMKRLEGRKVTTELLEQIVLDIREENTPKGKKK